MNVVKGLVAGLLCFLLLLCLSVFGAALVVNTTVLNEDFMAKQVQKLNVSELVQEIVDEHELIDLPAEVEFIRPYLIQLYDDYDPWLREQADNVIKSGYAYFLGDREELDITVSLIEIRNTLSDKVWALLQDNINEVLPELLEGELAQFIEDNLDQYRNLIPKNLVPAGVLNLPADELASFLINYLDNINLELVMMLSPQVSDLIDELLRPYVDQYIDEFIDDIPVYYVIDAQEVGPETMETLESARRYLGYFQTGFFGLIGIIVLLIIGVFLVYRDVKNTTLALGITMAFYGLMELITSIVGRSISYASYYPADVPSPLQDWMTAAIGDVIMPLIWFSASMLAVGIVLIVISVVGRVRFAAD